MNNSWIEKWDERYKQKEFVYGKTPNLFFKEQISKLTIGSALFPAEGEGRNAVFAAQLGWAVAAFDISSEAKKKALLLAKENNVKIDYQVGCIDTVNYNQSQFDAIVLIYAHFAPNMRSEIHKKLSNYLKTNGLIILEGFSKNHTQHQQTNEKVGGPRNSEALFSIEEIKADFYNYNIIQLTKSEVYLNEGISHNGYSSVIRFIGQKK